LFNVYARYEYYRARFEHRTGGVTTPFNPYILPGFSAVVFDEKSSGFDTIGYVTTVRHTFSADAGGPTMRTQVGLTHMRSFPEFINYLKQGFEESLLVDDPVDYDCGPTEPIPDVAALFQKETKAGEFFGRIFYDADALGRPTAKQHSVFLWRNMVKVYNVDGQEVLGPEDWEFEDGVLTKAAPAYEKEFRSFDAAMHFVSRPVCTLRQFIELRHGNELSKLLKDPQRKVRGTNVSYYSSARSKGRGATKGGATFWARIDALRQGPGNPTDENIQSVTNVGPAYEYDPLASWTIISSKMGVPQTRRDWDRMLRKYRSIIRGEKTNVERDPLAPQL
jgi:hypothetical protein